MSASGPGPGPSATGPGRRSPLADVPLPDGARELPFLAQVGVRGDHRAIAPAVHDATGLDLPTEPNTVTSATDLAALWLGPDEWLVVGPPGHEHALEASIRAPVADRGGSVVDLSANRTTIELHGPGARALLASGCTLDLDARAFGPGACAQTLFARVDVILWRADAEPEPTFRLLVRPSFAAYVAAWLVDAAAADD